MVKKRKFDITENHEHKKYPTENCCIACLSEDSMTEVKTQQTVQIYEDLIQIKVFKMIISLCTYTLGMSILFRFRYQWMTTKIQYFFV